MASNLEFRHASEEQLKTLVDHNIGLEEIHRINDRKSDIWDKVKDALEFSDHEKTQIREKLDNGLSDSSIEEVNKFAGEVDRRKERVRGMIDTYFSQLDTNQKYFARREGYDALKKYKEEFLQLDESGKQEWLERFHEEMEEKKRVYEELSQYVSEDHLQRMRRSEQRRMKRYLEECNTILRNYQKLFSPEEENSYRAQMADCTDDQAQRSVLEEMMGQIDRRKELASIHQRLPAKYREIWGNISQMSIQEREAGYEKLVVRIEEEYEKKLENHPGRKHIAPKDRKAALAYVRSDKPSGGDKFRALKKLDAQIKEQKEKVSDPFEATLTELSEYRSPREIKKLRDRFYDATTYEERQNHAKEVQNMVIEAQNEAAEAEELGKEYRQRLEADMANRLIGKKTYKEALKRWEKKEIEDKRETMTIYNLDKARRTKLLKEFEALPHEVQDKNKAFYEMTHTDRKALMEKLRDTTPTEEKPEERKETEEEAAQETTRESKKQQKEQPETPDQKIERLAARAATATRAQNYKQAIQLYEQMLELDPDYEAAAMSIEFLERKIAQQEKATVETPEKTGKKQSQKLSSAQIINMKEAINAAANSNAVMTRRRRNSMTEVLVHNLKKAEMRHGSSKAKDRITDMNERDKIVAGQLNDYTGETYILQDGEARKVIWFHKEGYRDKLNQSNERKVENQLYQETSGNKNKVLNNVQSYNDSNGVSAASVAEQRLKVREEETKDLMKNIAKQKLTGPENDEILEDALNDEVDKKDISVELRAA